MRFFCPPPGKRETGTSDVIPVHCNLREVKLQESTKLRLSRTIQVYVSRIMVLFLEFHLG